jgi:glutaredoxin
MKKLLVIVAFVIVGLKLHSVYQKQNARLEPQFSEPYIVVYGRKTCGNTLHLQTALHSRGYRYRYVDVDAEGVSDHLHQRMDQAGLETDSYTLPVVEVNARMQTNPKPEWVFENYRIDHTGKRI